MAKTDKTLERMRNNPRGWRIESLEAVALRFGIVVRKPPGSHVVFQHEASVLEVSVPAHRPIKPIYVKQFLGLDRRHSELSHDRAKFSRLPF